jgi:ATP-dependent helicase/nuclease subunit A
VSGKVFPLFGSQRDAVEPRDSVWLSASAGTGKTQVLSARVLRLLLQPGVSPENILCLTFTKAGAAEMADRVNAVLARWVRMPETQLFAELDHIGAAGTPDLLARARTLFASVLDCPGGGLRIDTIHAFSQWLLASFPEEAGLTPGTRPMEDRDREVLAHQVLADLLVDWERAGEEPQLAALEDLSLRIGPDKAREWLMRCATAREAWFGPGSWQEPLRERVQLLLGVPAGADAGWAAQLCGDDVFDIAALRLCMEVAQNWGTASAVKLVEAGGDWLAGDAAARAEDCAALRKAFFTADDKPRWLKNLEKLYPGYGDTAGDLLACLDQVAERQRLLALVDRLVPALTVGRRFALAWEEAKSREGMIDFDDLIRRAAALLREPGLGEWIRYKLDRQFDHILVDEAQDTNPAQWAIIRALTDDFFTGQGQRDGRLRTIFVVGDYKQAIFRFQGTSPENFALAKQEYAREMAERAANAGGLRDSAEARTLRELGLDRSYRTAQPVLDFVDRAVEAIGPVELGLKHRYEPHVGEMRPGLVTLWEPVGAKAGADPDEADGGEDGDGSDQAWLPKPERDMADAIARQVRQWLNQGFPLAKGEPRNAQPGDIMVLVRKRRELAGLIVQRLHAAGVPVAGVDRLRLGAPLAVKDVMAAVRFAAQPLDDLSLANLLVSPLVGWSQEQLLQHGYRARGVGLWHHLQHSEHPDVLALMDLLDPLLARADFEPPQALLHWLLVGPWQGRSKLVARLGREANDPLDELLNAALAFAASHTPSLQGFIRWFDAGQGELKRDAGAAGGLVRVMTVHGSKGLQSPIVILADATGNPDSSPPRGLSLQDGDRAIPMPELPADQKIAALVAAEEEARREEREEHWRLLYVAMTRAEEALFIGGALGLREEAPAVDSWYARLAPLLTGELVADPIWGTRREWGVHAPRAAPRTQEDLPLPAALPGWALRPIGPEPRPPRPLAPSAAGADQGSDPPLPPEASALAARRGVIIHRLLERLPDIAVPDRQDRARRWLTRHAADLPEPEREDMLARALAVLAEPAWADLFGPAALAEVPLAATVDGQVIAGTADRLLVLPDRVLVADFKTARRPPGSLDQVPQHTLRQMSAYVAALGAIYPGRAVEAAVLYTQTPQLIALPADLLARHKPQLPPVQESLGA